MEIVLIHRPVGMTPPEVMKRIIDNYKKTIAKPEEVVPGGKLIAAYAAMSQQTSISIWDVPGLEALTPMLTQLSTVGWNTEIIPVEKAEEAIPNLEKAMQAI